MRCHVHGAPGGHYRIRGGSLDRRGMCSSSVRSCARDLDDQRRRYHGVALRAADITRTIRGWARDMVCNEGRRLRFDGEPAGWGLSGFESREDMRRGLRERNDEIASTLMRQKLIFAEDSLETVERLVFVGTLGHDVVFEAACCPDGVESIAASVLHLAWPEQNTHLADRSVGLLVHGWAPWWLTL